LDQTLLRDLENHGVVIVRLADVQQAPDWVLSGLYGIRIQTASRWISTEFEPLSQWGHPELSIVTHADDGVRRRNAVLSRQSGEVVSVGRAGGGSDIEIEDRHVSATHLEFRYRDGAWRVRDAKSRHGTALNGKKLTRGAKLSHGDELTIGRTVIRYVDYDEELRRLMARDTHITADSGTVGDADPAERAASAGDAAKAHSSAGGAAPPSSAAGSAGSSGCGAAACGTEYSMG